MKQSGALVLVALLAGLVGCTSEESYDASVAGMTDASLAYEHLVDISTPAAVLNERLEAVRTACTSETLGSCSVIEFSQSQGDYQRGTIKVRIVPEGVTPLVDMASEGGTVASVTTRAQDLQVAVEATALAQTSLEAQRVKLLEYQTRDDLTATDLINIAKELSSVEAQLAAANRDAAQQQQRLETNLVTIYFSPVQSAWDRFTRNFDDPADYFGEAFAGILYMLAFGIPLLILLFPLALLWRSLWRRATTRKDSRP